MKFMKVFLINILLLMLLSASAISQNMVPLLFINELDAKKTTTYGDALRMFRFHVRTNSRSGEYMLKGYYDDLPLTKGMASLMVASYLGLNKSLMFDIFGRERYAYRACLADKLFSESGSENDLMSGPELIELFAKIDEFNKDRRISKDSSISKENKISKENEINKDSENKKSTKTKKSSKTKKSGKAKKGKI